MDPENKAIEVPYQLVDMEGVGEVIRILLTLGCHDKTDLHKYNGRHLKGIKGRLLYPLEASK